MNHLIGFALRQRVLVVAAFLALLGGGVVLFQRLNIEAYPDPTPPMVDVVTQVQGLSSEEMERYITIPIEVQMAGMPYLKAIRTISLFGLSDVSCSSPFDFTYEQALQQVLNRLSQLQPPNNAQPQINRSARSARSTDTG
jgi:cobalt-zinc-cadmium resistance protein CzcA